MTEIFEFFFCPAHGLLRPENLTAIIATVGQSWAFVTAWLSSIYAKIILDKYNKMVYKQ